MALKKANIEDFTWHDIRHTTASYLAMQGASSSEIASVLGFSAIKNNDKVGLILFSDAVNIHPFAILLSILFFGSVWGIWGVFFAIPLAVLINTILNVWPRTSPEGNI